MPEIAEVYVPKSRMANRELLDKWLADNNVFRPIEVQETLDFWDVFLPMHKAVGLQLPDA